MKILVLAPQPFYQDTHVSIMLQNLLETLAEEGHAPTAMVYPGGELLSIAGCRLLRVRKLFLVRNISSGFSWKNFLYDSVMIRMVARLLKREKFDLLLAVEGASFMTRRLSRKFRIPYVYHMSSSLPQIFCEEHPALSLLRAALARYEKRTIKGSAGVLACCKHLAEVAESYDTATSVQLLEGPSLISAALPAARRKETDLGPSRGCLTLMYIGTLEHHQGIDLLLEAFSLACLDKEKLRLVLIGGSKADISRYQRKAKTLGVGDGVLLTGPRPARDLAHYLAQADILVSPAISGDNTPLKLYSYLDAGKPLLATRLDMHTSVLDDSIALLVDAVDSEMAAGILRLARDTQLRSDLAQRARQRVAAEYNREAYRRKLGAFFTALRQQPAPE